MSELNLVGYDPKCKLYKREQTEGNVMWYISYYLPNGLRRQRPAHKNRKEANNLLRVKQSQLIQGMFDSKDLGKMKELFPEPCEKERLTIEKAIQLYLDVTESRKTASTRQSEKYAIKNYFSILANSQKEYIDEITPLDVQMLIQVLKKSGKSEATIITAVAIVRKVYNCLIDDFKVCSVEHPVLPNKKLFGRNIKKKQVRDRLATDEEIKAILSAEKPSVTHSSSYSPIDTIIPFLIFTGARLSEALHAEWDDFDLKNGVWNIEEKTICPTKYGLGWSPKWGQNRQIILFQEALDILRSMPKVNTIGKVPIRNSNEEIIGHETHPANFVFPKKEIRKMLDGNKTISYSRIDSLKRSWSSLKKRAGVSDLQIKDIHG